MKERSLSWYLFISVAFHVAILLFFLLSINTITPLSVIENTHQQDVISAVVLGDTAKSKILPHDDPKSAPIKKDIKKPEPEQKTVQNEPLPKKAEQSVTHDATSDAIALESAIKKKKENKLEIKPIFGQDLLADIKKESRKQKKKQEKSLQNQFKKTLQEQAEKSLRQQLLNENIKLKSQEAHLSQGEVNKYKALIVQAISENWLVPPGVNQRLSCELMIRVAKGGRVLDVQVSKSSGDQALDRSAKAAVLKASPLPVPSDDAEFKAFRQFALKVKPENVLMRR